MTEQLSESVRDEIRFTEWLETLRAQVIGTINGVTLRGARPVPIGTGGRAKPSSSAGTLVGYAIRNTGAVPASLVLRDGHETAAGEILVPITLAVGESVRDWFGPGGINVSTGLLVETVAGTFDGAVFLVEK